MKRLTGGIVGTRVFEGPDALARLDELDLDATLFRDAAIVGLTERYSRSLFAPRTAGGFDQWSGIVETVRQGLHRLEWTRNDTDNFPRSVSPNGSIAIGVTSGDAATGIRELSPKTARKKGPAMQSTVAVNHAQGELFALPRAPRKAITEPMTYLLVIFVDKHKRHVRAELSSPYTHDDGVIDGWIERIILPPVDIDPIDPATRRMDDDAPAIDVQVRRRG